MSYRVRFGKHRFSELIKQGNALNTRDAFRMLSTPAIFDGVRIQRYPTQFLDVLSRGGGYFDEQAKFVTSGSKVAKKKTLIRYANELKLFLDWMRQSNLDEMTVELDELNKFADDMGDGWPIGNTLDLDTIKSRYSIAAKYISYLSWLGVRSYFKPNLAFKSVSQSTGRQKSVSRKRVQYEIVCPTVFIKPNSTSKVITASCLNSDRDAQKVCSEGRKRQGPIGLMYELVFRAGLRSSELVGVRVSDLDNAKPIGLSSMAMKVEVGAKGELKGVSKDGMALSKRRLVWVPADLYERLQNYRHGLRNATINEISKIGFVRFGHKRVVAKEHESLFLSAQTGMPFEEKTIQNYFRDDAKTAGFKGFGIHKGRSHFGCHFLLDKACQMSGIKFQNEDGNPRPAAISDLNELQPGQQIELLRTLSSPVTREMLREFLGHERYGTTIGYVRYLESIITSIQSQIRNETWAN